MTDLKSKAIDIKGKKYVLVSDRVIAFNEMYPNGSIQTELISDPNSEMVVIKATVFPDLANINRKFTGYSQAKWGDGYINKTSALENCETSAVGRALGMMGIGVIDSIASADEIMKAESKPKSSSYRTPITENQIKLLRFISSKKENPQEFIDWILAKYKIERLEMMLKDDASKLISKLNEQNEQSN